MEENNPSSLFELSIDHESSQYLTETARWAKFLAIVGFVTCGLLAVLSFFIGSLLSRNVFAPYGSDGAAAISGAAGGLITALYLAFALLYFFPCLFLYQFSIRLKAALRDNDQVKLNQSLKSQKSLFKFIGILTIIVLGFYALGLIVVMITSMFTHR
jgi:Family of unknown function (DUF5362)